MNDKDIPWPWLKELKTEDAREIDKLRNLVNMQNKLIEDFLRTEAALIRELQEINSAKCSCTTTN